MEKNFKKAAVNPFVKANSGGIILKGINVGYSTEAPTYFVEFLNNGNSVDFTLTSGNAAQFEFIRFGVTDAAGNGASGLESGGTTTLDITNVNKIANVTSPDASVEIVYKLLGQEQVLSYSVNIDAVFMIDGNDLNTADALNSNKRGAYLEIDTVGYDNTLGAEETNINVIGAIGLVGYTLEGEVNGNTATAVVNATGTAAITVAGLLAPGTYTVTVKVTNSGSEYGSFTTATLTV
jgi:hypothetical protein